MNKLIPLLAFSILILVPLVAQESFSDSTPSLILAGAQTNAVWIMSALVVIGSVAFGALYIISKKI